MPRGLARGASSSASEGSSSTAPGSNGKMGENEEKQRQNSLFHKTKMCRFNQIGMCTRGNLCRFAHGSLDMNPLPDLSRTKLCAELINTGQCSDPKCKFAHTRRELRRHPFVLASDSDQSGLRSGVRRQPRVAAAPDEAPGQGVAQLQANANLLCSDLVKVLSRMQQTGQVGSSALYGDLAHVLKGFGESELVDTSFRHNHANGGFVSPEFDSVTGVFSDESLAGGWWKNHKDRLNAVYLSPPDYHGAGMGGAAEMEHLTAPFAWEEDSFYQTLLDERAAPPGQAVAAEQHQKPEPKLLSPMYAPSMSLSVPPPLALA